MRNSVSVVSVIVAVAIASSSASLSAAPVTSQPTTTNARIVAMQKRLDRFEARIDRQESRLYVSRDRAGVRVAQAAESRTSRNNR